MTTALTAASTVMANTAATMAGMLFDDRPEGIIGVGVADVRVAVVSDGTAPTENTHR